jgi:hypothetical protein
MLARVLAQTRKEEGIALSNLYDKLETRLRAVGTLGVTIKKYASMLCPLVESALPEDALLAWERAKNASEVNKVIF